MCWSFPPAAAGWLWVCRMSRFGAAKPASRCSSPVYAADPAWLIKGDKVRIIKGQFKDIEARIVIRPRTRRKEIMVCIEN